MAGRAAAYAGIEAGGTKFVLGVGTADGGSIAGATVPTGAPEATLAAIAAFFGEASRTARIGAFGLASFGPVDLAPASPGYGRILRSPKRAWSGFDLFGALRGLLGVPGAVDTDVNAAALAEAALGAGAAGGTRDLAYVTIGTGIGVGLVVDGRAVHGIAHPEAGHIRPRRDPRHEGFAGICPFHGDCLEGLASGPAIGAAWGAEPPALPPEHPAWDVQAGYVAQLCETLILTVAPALIVLGGGAMRPGLFPRVRAATAAGLAGYGRETDGAALERRIVAPGCGEAPGLIGAYLLAERAAHGIVGAGS